MPLNGYKKAGSSESLPLRYNKDNTFGGEIQISHYGLLNLIKFI